MNKSSGVQPELPIIFFAKKDTREYLHKILRYFEGDAYRVIVEGPNQSLADGIDHAERSEQMLVVSSFSSFALADIRLLITRVVVGKLILHVEDAAGANATADDHLLHEYHKAFETVKIFLDMEEV